MTADRIVEFQRQAILRQQEHLEVALAKLRRHADELELAREHNATLLALLDRSRRETAALRAELEQVRAALDGVQTGEPR